LARDYRKITAFQKVDDLAARVYEATRDWPKEERYGLTSQVRRAVVSAAANIVEGASRNTDPEYLHFLSIARGSLREAGYLLHLATRLGHLDKRVFADIHSVHDEANRILFGLIQSVASSVQHKKADRVREDTALYLTTDVLISRLDDD
jgi:four helix bundle protein